MADTAPLFNINPQSSVVAFVGDTHGVDRYLIEMLRRARDAGAKHVFHVGDFGLFTEDRRSYRFISNSLTKHYDMNLWVTFGNHDDYSLVRDMADDELFRTLSPNIHVFNRPAMFTLGDKTILSLSGAASIDRYYRMPNVDWWEEEAVTASDVEAVERLVDAYGRPDWMITHDGPFSQTLDKALQDSPFHLSQELEVYSRESQFFVNKAVEYAAPQHLFHGHHHFRYEEEIGHGADKTAVHGLSLNAMPGCLAIVDVETGNIVE